MSSIRRFDTDNWQASAACTGENATMFYPPMRTEDRRSKRLRESHAKAICAGCPVQFDCLEHALEHDERYGIWGGLTDRERRTALRSVETG